MGFFDIFKSKSKEEKRSNSFFGSGGLTYSNATTYTQKKALLLSTVYRCVEVISDSVAQLPIYLYKVDDNGFKTKFVNHSSFYLLNKEPNNTMTRFTFIKSMITSMLLNGNAYAYIDREGLRVKGIYFLRPEMVTIDYTTKAIKNEIVYVVKGLGQVDSCDMIHLLNFSYDGISGLSTLSHAKNTLTLAHDAEAHARGFFESGAGVSGILKVDAPLTEEQRKDIKDSWATAFGSGSGQQNGIAVLEGNMSFNAISINPSDAQLLETREFNVIDICRFFGVSPVKAFDLSKSSYSTVEATQLAFLTDTIAPLLEKIELEFERKLFLPSERRSIDVKFDTSVLLRADKTSQANYYNQLFNIGVYTINDIRKDLDLSPLENGDNSYIQLNMQTINQSVENNTTDNKVDETSE